MLLFPVSKFTILTIRSLPCFFPSFVFSIISTTDNNIFVVPPAVIPAISPRNETKRKSIYRCVIFDGCTDFFFTLDEKRTFDLVIFSDNSRKVRLHARIMSPLRNLKILFPVFHSRQKENTVRFMMQHFRGIMYYDFTLRISIMRVSRRRRYIAVPCRFSVYTFPHRLLLLPMRLLFSRKGRGTRLFSR